MSSIAQMNFIVKICGITHADDALSAADAGANAIGFNFYPKSPRCISLEAAHAIAALLPDSVLKVGVFVEPSTEELLAAIDRVPLDVIQLHGRRVPSIAHRTWRALNVATADPTESLVAEAESLVAEAILLDADTPHHGGSGRSYDWKLAARFWQPVIVAGGLAADNVAEAIESARPWGVDACSRLESSPGVKDRGNVRAFIESAWSTFRSLNLPGALPAAAGFDPEKVVP